MSLQAILDAARAERHQQRVLVVGAEGVGRTRLLKSAANLHVELGRGRLVAQTLRALLNAGASSDDELLAAITSDAALASVEPERAAVASELIASLLGIRRPDFRTAKLDEDSRREGAMLELGRWIIGRAQDQVFVLAVDDVHLADDEGIAFLEALSNREEPASLVVLASYDSDPARHSPAFAARREVWISSGKWRRLELRAPPESELRAGLLAAGATEARVTAVLGAAKGNPALAFGLLDLIATLPADAPLPELPGSLAALRLGQVKALGDDTLRAVAMLAGMGGVAPLAALASVSPEVPVALTRAASSGFVEMTTEGPWVVARLRDQRLREALGQVLSQGQVLGARLAVGAWAVQALEELDDAHFHRLAAVLVPIATPALDGPTASLWDEALAATRGGRAETIAALDSSLRNATGVRRLVLLRRIAELKLFLGLPDQALSTVLASKIGVVGPSSMPPLAVGRVLRAQAVHVLDRWDQLTAEEASIALELVRAECLSFLVKKEDTQRAYAELEKRLLKARGVAVSHLWIRWAKGWSWFLCEIVGRAADAMAACSQVRRNVSEGALAADEDAIAFVRAEEVATSSLGQFARAKALTEEHIRLAEGAGKLRDACLGWNARAIVHYGQGELLAARKAFERALELARTTGWLRREAISLHNLTLVLIELGELDQAFANETTYGQLSVLVGNHAGKAEAPLVLASIELARGRLKEAEALITPARRVAESNGWHMLVAWSRALTGRLRLKRYRSGGDVLEVTKAKNDLLAAIEIFEESSLAWMEELDPGEVFSDYAMALKWSGQGAQARQVLNDALKRIPSENTLSRKQLEVASALASETSAEVAVQWFEENHFRRRADQWRKY